MKLDDKELRATIDAVFGDDLLEIIADPETTEVYLNGNGDIYRVAGENPPTLCKREQSTVEAQKLIAHIASAFETQIDTMRPHFEQLLPWYGVRFAASLPPWTDGPLWSVRKITPMPSG